MKISAPTVAPDLIRGPSPAPDAAAAGGNGQPDPVSNRPRRAQTVRDGPRIKSGVTMFVCPRPGFDRQPSGKGRARYNSPSAFIMSRERAKASTVASTSASPWVAEMVPPGQPVRSTPFTFIASLSFCAAPGALPRSSS